MTSKEASTILNAFSEARLSLEAQKAFLEMWRPIEFKRGEVLTDLHEIEKHFYVVIEGVQCVYLLSEKGHEVVIAFSFNGSYSGVYDSFMDRKPSSYTLKALTDSVLYAIDYESYESLFEHFNGFDRWGRIIHGTLLRGRVQREVELLTLNSQERFLRFMRRCPKELQQIPRKYLASYLNMTQETFSRLYNTVNW